ncbi:MULTISPECIES: peptidyl-prolyl cis-trans isomerase [Leuconostoc]|uniref:Foldase protein PrsA n=2 Tax=Leuconostoc kimchii TaxID=136609 RepID=D5T3Z0_LEUKI|nr:MULTISPECIES: peptidyl-prolyl cis-trans isomerase [Leuconostoc]ADG41392.1 peptidylprolyl isomerase [Leuconostoc kimchii IMSNU 11154]AEJ30628.1 peptidylprolyl isomerase [Leuconostoc sp. C2]QBR47741.1 peptidylprolyl isomerase [Leuconostoc kimchii]
MRKFIWGLLVVIFIGGLVFLGLNSSKTLMTSDSGKITENEFMADIKKSSAGQQEFANMVINKVLAKQYGGNVSKSDVQDAFDTQKAQYGDSFKQALASNNTTEDQLKINIKNNLIMTAAVKANYKITDKQLNDAYKNYHQNTTISLITAKNEDAAKKAIDDLKSGDNWKTVYAKYTADKTYAKQDGQLPAFDSTSTAVDTAIQEAAFKLNKSGDYTNTPVTGSNGGYYVVTLNKKTNKPSLNSVRNKLSDQIVSSFLNDQKNTSKIQAIVGKILRKENVNVKDSQLKNTLNTYMTAGISSSK